MRIQSTIFKIWQKEHKASKSGKEYVDLFLSERVKKKDGKFGFNNFAAIAFNETAKEFTDFGRGDFIKVNAGVINVDDKTYKARITIFDFERFTKDGYEK